jgi:hypothetical protein
MMNRDEYDLYLRLVDEMLGRLDALARALERGIDCRNPLVKVETSEIRALDILGLRFLGDFLPETALRRVWHLHEDDECSPIHSSVVRLQANRTTFQLVCQRYGITARTNTEAPA